MRFGRIAFCVILLGLLWLAAPAANAQIIGVTPQALSFSYQIGGAIPAPQSLYLYTDTPSQFSVSVSGAPWMTVAPSSGVTPSTLVVTITPPSPATPGTLTGSIIIGPPASADNLRTVVTVSLQVLPGGPGNLVVNPPSMTFDYQSGGPNPAQIAMSITTSTGAPGTFAIAASTTSGGNWLFVSTPVLVTPVTAYAYVIPPPGMAPGIYTGSISVIPTYTGATTVPVQVTLRVSSAGQFAASPSSLAFNYQPTGPLPPAQVVNVTNSTGGAATFAVSSTTVSGGNWLLFSPANATTPAGVVVSVNPGGLAAGTYYGAILIAPAVGGPATQVQVSLTVYNFSQLTVAPDTLTFQYRQTDVSPPPQYLAVKSTGAPIIFNASVSGPSWITLSTASATTPTGVAVLVNPPSTIAAGTYNANVVLVPASGPGSYVTVPVTVQVTPANSLTLGTTSVVFDYSIGGAIPASAIIPVTSTPNSVRFSLTLDTAGSGNWLRASQSVPYTPASVTVSVSPTGLDPGIYTGTVSIISDQVINSPQTIAVTLNVTRDAVPTATPFGLVFSYQMGGTVPPQQAVVVSSPGVVMPFSVDTQTTTGGSWLRAAGDIATPAVLLASVDPTQLGPGTYTGKILITPNTQPSNPIQVVVVLNVSPSGVMLPSVGLAAFQYQTNGANPAAQTARITTSDNSATVFYPTPKTADGAPWLKTSPDFGVAPVDLTISVAPQGLTAGLYSGVVTLTDAAGITPTTFVPVSLQVSDGPVLIIPYQTLTFSAAAGGASTATQTVTIRSSQPNTSFRVNTNGVSWMLVNPPSGTTGSGSQTTLSVAASPSGLSAGGYLGVLTIDIPGVDGSQQNLPVVFTVR